MSSCANDIKPLPNAFGTTDSHYWYERDVTPAKPLVELEMTKLSATLRSKSFWWTKFRDQDILAKWRAKALEQAGLMKESHIDYVLKELSSMDTPIYAMKKQGPRQVACYDRIWQSDKLVLAQLKAKLIAGVAKPENVPDSEKDWHPRSNGQVLDLVHPSLYPI
ncbi:hypothetical protein FRC06_006409, partial [Ceratobasidium sp. 370]